MKRNRLNGELIELITHTGGPCVSMIVPLKGTPGPDPATRTAIRHALEKVRQQFTQMNHQETLLMEKAEQLAEEAQIVRGECGVGIFVSHTVSRLSVFPFDVNPDVQVSDHFVIKDLVHKQRVTQPYYVLLITAKGARLFGAHDRQFDEINDAHFPISYDGVDYEIPAVQNQGNNTASATRRDAAVTTGSTLAYYNRMDEKLTPFLSGGDPLFIAGTEKEVAGYLNHTCHRQKILAEINGSYDTSTLSQLHSRGSRAMELYLKEEERVLLKRLREAGREYISTGIKDVWNDVQQGKGNILLVERDLRITAYVGENPNELQFSPAGDTHQVVEDAANVVVQMMLERNGRIVFVEKGALHDYRGIAMLNRY